MTTIQITLAASERLAAEYPELAGGVAVTFELPDHLRDLSDHAICEALFSDTNRYEGELWDVLQPLLPENRSHTALSVDDLVSIDDNTYKCQSIGWAQVEKDGRPHHEVSTGIFGGAVCARCGALCEDDEDDE